ncbi:MAG: Txe/YoeB family addiction module toxin [bacterium]
MYKILFTPQALFDAKKISSSKLQDKVKDLLKIVEKNPYSFPPPFEILSGKLKGLISRRINKKHRLVYQVFKEEKIIKVVKLWTHYE